MLVFYQNITDEPFELKSQPLHKGVLHNPSPNSLHCQVLHLITKCHKFYININIYKSLIKTLILVNHSSNLSLLNNYLLRYTFYNLLISVHPVIRILDHAY